MIAACAHAVIIGRKVSGLYDHSAGRYLRIAAERRGNHVQALDGERSARFGGTLPELYDEGEGAFTSLETDGNLAKGYDRASAGFYSVQITERLAQLYDHNDGRWFAYDVQIVDEEVTQTG
jgi:hypothetical protein